MKAVAKCPKCKEILNDDCEACIAGGIAVHGCLGEKEWGVRNVDWKIIDCTEKEAETIKALGFKGKLPEILN